MRLVDNFNYKFNKKKGRYNSIGRVSICDIESYRFESYYLPIKKNNLLKYKQLKNIKLKLNSLAYINLLPNKEYFFKKLFTFKRKNFILYQLNSQFLTKSNLVFYLFYNNKITKSFNLKHSIS